MTHASSAPCGRQLLQLPRQAQLQPRLRIEAFSSVRPRLQRHGRTCFTQLVRASAEQQEEAAAQASEAPAGAAQPGDVVEIPDDLKSDADKKQEEIDRLRAAEKFMKQGTGEGECKACGYAYSPSKGDDEYPVPKGTLFENLPEDWQCPVCGADKKTFKRKEITVAGFAQNQGYGLGTNSMTEGQKSLLIFGSLGFFFVLFLLGYLFN